MFRLLLQYSNTNNRIYSAFVYVSKSQRRYNVSSNVFYVKEFCRLPGDAPALEHDHIPESFFTSNAFV